MPLIQPTKASIETCTACNHTCKYCPVSEFPQKQQVMPPELFQQAMGELESLNHHFRRISFSHYNETLIDPLFLDRVRNAMGYDFFDEIWVFSNLAFMPDSLPRELQYARDRLLFRVNLPTAIRERYREIQGVDDFSNVEKNVFRLIEAGFRLKINVQRNRFTTEQDAKSVVEKFGLVLPVRVVDSNSRAGLVEELSTRGRRQKLEGCLLDNRPIDYVHIAVDGDVFLCCQDFFKRYRFGNIRNQRLREILASGVAKEHLAWVYGEKEAPDDFICRNCEFSGRSKERE